MPHGEAADKAQHAGPATSSEWLDHAIRVGLVAYGIVHLMVGWLALQLAFGEQGGPGVQPGRHALPRPAADGRGARLDDRHRHDAAGRSGGSWSSPSATPRSPTTRSGGASARPRWARRSSTARSAWSAFKTATGDGGGKGGTDTTTAKIMQLPGGQLHRRRGRARDHRLRHLAGRPRLDREVPREPRRPGPVRPGRLGLRHARQGGLHRQGRRHRDRRRPLRLRRDHPRRQEVRWPRPGAADGAASSPSARCC